MEGRFFEPDDKICLIFDNVSYDKLRELPEYARTIGDELEYADMPRAREWANELEEGIKKYGISADQIQRYSDADYDTMDKAIYEGPNSALHKIAQNAKHGERTLLLCFYAGHGATVDSKTSVLLNTNDRNDWIQFDLEDYLDEWFIKEKGTYVISLFACDRSGMLDEEEEFRGGTEELVFSDYDSELPNKSEALE